VQSDQAQGRSARGLRQHQAQAEARMNNFRFSIADFRLIEDPKSKIENRVGQGELVWQE
jgi:hypothetical protein